MNDEREARIVTTEKIEWLAPEYEHREQTVDWYWALSIIIIATCVTSIIYENYFFALLILLGGSMLGYFSSKKPGMMDYELNDEGLKIRDRLHPYETIKHFWVQETPKPILHIESDRVFLPTLSMPIYPIIANKIREKMLAHGVLEQEIKDHPSVMVMEYLGF
jgi:hypothetical protein